MNKCSPKWQAILYEYDDENAPKQAFGFDPEVAALSFAEDNFSAWEYPEKMEIWIRKPGDIEWQKFEVTVESVPSFSATKIA